MKYNAACFSHYAFYMRERVRQRSLKKLHRRKIQGQPEKLLYRVIVFGFSLFITEKLETEVLM